MLAPRPNCDYLVPRRRNLEISRDLTIDLRNEGYSHILLVTAHLLVVVVCLGKFWMARTAAGKVRPDGPQKMTENVKFLKVLKIINLTSYMIYIVNISEEMENLLLYESTRR